MKTYHLLLFLAPALIFVASACHTVSDTQFALEVCDLGEPFILQYGQTTECDEVDLSFSGDIQDSRCPETVVCVWAGRVDVQLQFGTEMISLGVPADPNFGPSVDTVGNRRIELLEVFPAAQEAPTPQAAYQIKLLVSEI